jgi:hypothetical protein
MSVGRLWTNCGGENPVGSALGLKGTMQWRGRRRLCLDIKAGAYKSITSEAAGNVYRRASGHLLRAKPRRATWRNPAPRAEGKIEQLRLPVKTTKPCGCCVISHARAARRSRSRFDLRLGTDTSHPPRPTRTRPAREASSSCRRRALRQPVPREPAPFACRPQLAGKAPNMPASADARDQGLPHSGQRPR